MIHVAYLLALLAVAAFGALQYRRAALAERETSWCLRDAVQIAERLIAERHGDDERGRKIARDFCRYKPPDYVVGVILGREPL